MMKAEIPTDHAALLSGDGGLAPMEAAALAGATYRQVNHWIRNDYIQVHCAGRGSGYPQHLDAWEVNVLHVMTRLVYAGMDPACAARAARQITKTGAATLGAYVITSRKQAS